MYRAQRQQQQQYQGSKQFDKKIAEYTTLPRQKKKCIARVRPQIRIRITHRKSAAYPQNDGKKMHNADHNQFAAIALAEIPQIIKQIKVIYSVYPHTIAYETALQNMTNYSKNVIVLQA